MKKILISADPYETRVAIVEDNVVVETYLERATRRSLLGNVYLGRVDNVLPGMEAAFIDAGLPKNCFLYVDEIVLPELDDRERRKKKIGFEIPGLAKEAIQPVGIRIAKDGKKAFVALGPANRVAEIDGETYEVKRYILVGQRVWQLAFTPDEKYVIATNGISNDVSVIDTASNKVITTIKAGDGPWGVVIKP